MMLECLTVAQAVSRRWAHYTIQTDGTTKFGQKFSTFDIAEKRLLRHVFSGSAQTTLDTLLEILDDLNVVRKEIGQTSVSSKIIRTLCPTDMQQRNYSLPFSLQSYRWRMEGNVNVWTTFSVALVGAAEETLKLWEAANIDDDVTRGGKCSNINKNCL